MEVIMKTAKKNIIDLMVDAATNKELMDVFKKAKSAKKLQDSWLEIKPGYSITLEDCDKLLKGRVEILDAMEHYHVVGFY
jgi:hypothetical protein